MSSTRNPIRNRLLSVTSRPFSLASLVSLAGALAGSGFLAAGCGSDAAATTSPDPSGPGTDAGAVDALPDAPVDPLRPGDALRIETVSKLTDAHALVDTKVCYILTLLHSDGTSTKVLPGVEILVEPANTAIASSAPSEECETGGVIGVSPGNTPAKVTVGHGANAVSGVSLVSVEGGAWTLSSGYLAGYGPSFALNETTTIFAESALVANPERHPRALLDGLRLTLEKAGGPWPAGAELVYSWLEVTAAGGAEIERVDPHEDAWRVRGKAIGPVHFSVAYKGPKNPLVLDASATVVDLAPLTKGLVRAVFLDARGYPFANADSAHVAENSCFSPLLLVSYGSNDGNVSLEVDRPTGAWTATKSRGTATLVAGSTAGQVCAKGEGLLDVGGCSTSGQDCGTGHIEVLTPGSTPTAITLETTTTTPVVTQASPDHFGKHVVCLPLKAILTRSTGVHYDATDLVGWGLTSAKDSRIGSAGSATINASGQPCVELSDPSNPAASPNITGAGTTTVTVDTAYLNLTATSDVVVTGTWTE